MTYLIIHPQDSVCQRQVKELIQQLCGQKLKSAEWQSFHPDIHHLGRQERAGIEEVKELQREMQYRPFQLSHQFAVIWSIEKLSGPAQNALLKDLEDHSERSFYLITAAHQDQVLATIRSRARIIYPSADDETSLNTSHETVSLSAEDQEFIQLYKQAVLQSSVDYPALFKAIQGAVTTLSETAWEQLLVEVGELYREKLKNCLQRISTASEEVTEEDHQQLEQLRNRLLLVQQAHQQWKQNVNKRLVLENLLLQLTQES